jgi:hypothetical protein
MANTTGTGRNQSDKDRSKQMSRSVTANQAGRGNGRPGGKPAQGSGGPRRSNQRPSGGGPPNRGSGAAKRTGARPAGNRPGRRSPTALLTWGTAALVLVIVIVLVAVKVFGGGSPITSGSAWSPASSTVVSQVTGIPASVFDAVGTTSDVAPINPPIAISGQPPLTFPGATGSSLPGVYFYGAEYCPYCAAARWSIVAALSRFGTFHNLGNMQSTSNDIDPNTPTFTFSKAKYSSAYIVFKPQEYYSNQVNAAGTGYTVIMPSTKAEAKLVTNYDNAKYFPQTLQQGEAGFPFVDFGNKILQDTLYDPTILGGLSRDTIAANLTDPKNPITQAIVAGANYLSASVCHIDGQQPASVCASKGVTAATKALKLG